MTRVAPKVAVVDYGADPSPSSRYTRSSVFRAIKAVLPDWNIVESVEDHVLRSGEGDGRLLPALQISDYDHIEWEGVAEGEVIVNAYAIRKALIRKNALAHTAHLYTSKHHDSALLAGLPKTYPFELAFADELGELFSDDLYDLGLALDSAGTGGTGWWILKPAMADRGQGIRLFRTKGQLEKIFEEFEELSDAEDEAEQSATAVSCSQLRQWIIQEYIERPLLVNIDSTDACMARKHHLRVYALAMGALEVYVFTDVLALFADAAYALPGSHGESRSADESGHESGELDLRPHLTNTCLQTPALLPFAGSEHATLADPERNVRLFSSLVGAPLAPSCAARAAAFTQQQHDSIFAGVCALTAEAFAAASENPTAFQALPNVFEVFGVDFVVDEDLRPYLLEINACPDFAQTGSRLSSVVDQALEGALRLAAAAFFAGDAWERSKSAGPPPPGLEVGLDSGLGRWRKVFELNVRGGRRGPCSR